MANTILGVEFGSTRIKAVLNGEEHLSKIAHITTLAGFTHYMLTGVNAKGTTLEPEQADVEGFNTYIEAYKKLLRVEKAVVDAI